MEVVKNVDGKENNPIKILLRNEEKLLELSFLGNLDLYFSFYSKENDNTFEINKENGFVYNCFLELYNRIKNNDIVRLDNTNLDDIKTKEDLERKIQEIKEENDFIKRRGHYDELFHDGVITWKSGANMEDFMTIKEDNNKIILSFNFSSRNNFIRILNVGAYYYNYNIPFMEMFKKLIYYDFDKKQVNLDLYNNKTKKRIRN